MSHDVVADGLNMIKNLKSLNRGFKDNETERSYQKIQD
jgi:hypothetical protein